MNDLKHDTSWKEALESEDFKRSLTADLVFEAIRRRIELGLSQIDLAEKIDSTQSVISRFENLGRQPSIGFLERIAKALDLKLSATLNGDFMYIVPYRLQSFVKQSAEAQDLDSRKYLTNTITDHLDQCARESWKVIHKQKIDAGEDAVICQMFTGVFETPDWTPTHQTIENDFLKMNRISEDLQILAEM
jgi:transcriptional regulator with XRE-family HTH domain